MQRATLRHDALRNAMWREAVGRKRGDFKQAEDEPGHSEKTLRIALLLAGLAHRGKAQRTRFPQKIPSLQLEIDAAEIHFWPASRRLATPQRCGRVS